MPKTKLRVVRTPAQWHKLNQEIDKSVRALVSNDESAKHLAFLIGAVGTEANDVERNIVIRRVLQTSFEMTCDFDQRLAEWLDGESVAVKKRKRA
jgi:hypothetical protein